MFVIGGVILGIGLGLYRARKLGGKGPDLAQYGAVYGILFGIIGLVITIILARVL